MKIVELRRLIYQYGDLPISEIIKKINKPFVCPKCEGKGKNTVKYNAYPSGFPDSGFVEDWKFKDVECEVCNGHGYTEKELKPKN